MVDLIEYNDFVSHAFNCVVIMSIDWSDQNCISSISWYYWAPTHFILTGQLQGCATCAAATVAEAT